MVQPNLTDRDRFAMKVVELAKAIVLADCPFLSSAVGRLRVVPGRYRMPMATDGFKLGVDSSRVCGMFMSEEEPPKHDLLHSVLHCVFLHPYAGSSIDERLWNVACDIAVERIVSEICGTRGGMRAKRIESVIGEVENQTRSRLSAERVYRELRTGRWSEHVDEWALLFAADDHSLWYPESAESEAAGEVGGGEGLSSEMAEQGTNLGEIDRLGRNAEIEEWQRVARTLAISLRAYSRGKGFGGLIDELEDSSRSRTDYTDFLRQFAIPGEVLKVSDEEFDYVLYTYGLKLYGNLPLLEPLEYREEKRIREFVIVIDTSGSVWGDIVRRFIDTTFDVLKSTEAFFERVHVRIIQCDAEVRSDDKITNLAELKEWGRRMRLFGCGGTDFRPAFAYVDGLIEEGEFENLGGMVYFTDGMGAYPERMPAYKTAFVFYGDAYLRETVPSWAAQIVLDDSGFDGREGVLHGWS